MRDRRHLFGWLFLLFALVLHCGRPRPTKGSSVAEVKPAASMGSNRPVGASRAASEEKPPRDLNVVLLTIDSMRADMPWVGYPRPIAPNLSALSQKGVTYTHAYALSSYTSMSLGGLLGGRYPGEMKRDGYFFGRYRDNLMFPERLRAAGVTTMAAHAHLYFRKAGFERGFDAYELVPGLKWNPNTDENVTSPRLEKLAEKMLDDRSLTDGRFFAWFHFLDPHDEYKTHTEVPTYGRRARDRYDSEIAYTDQSIGRLLDFIAQKPWSNRTAIIVSADHGEAFGEHRLWRHGFELWQPLIHIPLIFVLPGASPKQIDVNRSHIDMAPTILELFGLSTSGMEGTSLVAELYSRIAPEPRDVIVDLPRTSDNDRRRALLHGQYKVIAYGDNVRYQVFDLDADPGETCSIQKTDRAKYDELVALYKSKDKSIQDMHPYACRKLKGAPDGRAY
jgi:choline-sulfatase